MAREGSTASDARDRRRHRPMDDMWRCFGRSRRGRPYRSLSTCRQGLGLVDRVAQELLFLRHRLGELGN